MIDPVQSELLEQVQKALATFVDPLFLAGVLAAGSWGVPEVAETAARFRALDAPHKEWLTDALACALWVLQQRKEATCVVG